LENQTFSHEGVTVRYRLRTPKQDRKHLVVAFAGVQKGRHDFYGFDGRLLDHLKAAVLWIMDSFDGQNSYYLCKDLDLKIQRAVAALIDAILTNLDLDKTDCTLLGSSKGATAALHLGLTYGYSNLVCAAPQTILGTYTRTKIPETFEYMANEDLLLSEQRLNEYLPNLVANPTSLDVNVYLLSSHADPEFRTHIEPLLPNFERFSNFNLLMTNSLLVQSHPDIAEYNTPFILSVLYSLSEGLAPKFGNVTNGGATREPQGQVHRADHEVSPSVEAMFHWVQLHSDKLRFSGYAAVKGNPSSHQIKTNPQLVFTDAQRDFHVQAQPVPDRAANSKLYDNSFVDYLWAGFTPESDGGLDLSFLPAGVYTVSATPANHGEQLSKALSTHKQATQTSVAGEWFYRLDANASGVSVSKISLDAAAAFDSDFHLDAIEIQGSALHISGRFAIPREGMRDWRLGNFVLMMKGENLTWSTLLSVAKNPKRSLVKFSNFIDSYKFSGFTSNGSTGIDLSNLVDGEYELMIAFVKEDRSYAHQVSKYVLKTGTKILLSDSPN
jgi:hypothetical protein